MNSGHLAGFGQQTGAQRLSHAFKKVSAAWFPANPDLLEEIQTAIRARGYSNAAQLVDAVRKDPSLYTRCLQSLHAEHVHNAGGDSTAVRLDPAEILNNADFELLARIVLAFDASAERKRF